MVSTVIPFSDEITFKNTDFPQRVNINIEIQMMLKVRVLLTRNQTSDAAFNARCFRCYKYMHVCSENFQG